MTSTRPLEADHLYQRCDPSQFAFESTAELSELEHLVGQERATEAVELAAGVRVGGYNLFILGQEGTGRRTFIRQFLQERARGEGPVFDWCYINNFDNPRCPKAMRLPAGKGRELAADLKQLVEDAQAAVTAAFESDDYRTRHQAIEEEFKEGQESAFEEVNQEAKRRGIGIIQTPTGIAFAPIRDGETLGPEDFAGLPPAEKERLERDTDELRKRLQSVLQSAPKQLREMREKIRTLDQEITVWAVGALIRDLFDKYEDIEPIVDYLRAIQYDIVENAAMFRSDGEEGSLLQKMLGGRMGQQAEQSPGLRRYGVNVLVDNESTEGAPVVFEDHPTHPQLLGRIEHVSQMGTLVTDFHLINAGALHLANGGYLVLDARKVLMQPLAWEGLKRVLRTGELRIQPVGQEYGLVSTVSIEPEPIAVSTKVVLIGERTLYYLLQALDPEFSQFFKVGADFEDTIDRSESNTKTYARLLATIARKEGLKPLTRDAVARIIEQSARQASDAEKLSAKVGHVTDIIREADYWAERNGADRIDAKAVARAVESRDKRTGRIRDRLQEAILRETILIDTTGETVGQINGLSVINLGDSMFGRPNRITARLALGSDGVVDIEREVELGGPIHSKGVLILSGFLASNYVPEQPLSLSASLVFEQSYGGVDGDSASAAELCTLLSALSEAPIKQSFAITGSVNQRGQVQAIGGVNEKIEGFFDVCKARGLSGEHGVLIPAANVKHLMLRDDVRAAAREGVFHVYAVETIDECMQILTGLPAGTRDADGVFPDASINGRVRQRLLDLAEQRQAFSRASRSEDAS